MIKRDFSDSPIKLFQSRLQKDKYYLFNCQLYIKSGFSFFIFSVSGYYLIGPIFSANKSFLLCYTQQCFFSLVFTREPLEHSLNRVIVSAWPASHFSVFDIFCYKMVNLFSNVFECIVSKLHLEVGIVACCVQMYGLVDTYQLTQD